MCTLINNTVEKKNRFYFNYKMYFVNIVIGMKLILHWLIDKRRYDWYEVSVYDSLLRPQNTFLSSTRIVRKDYSITKTEFNYDKIIFSNLIHVFLQHNNDSVKDVFIIIW